MPVSEFPITAAFLTLRQLGSPRFADVVQVFPNPAALGRLAVAVLAELLTTQPTEPEPQITTQTEPKQLP
jgi:hypothetical protein